ncbi:hypothetical protein GW17_00032084 [Ensete ventricosum]|nr:hypothetical protein GW17_00032084 [Ensete ventricosum]
MEGGGVAEKQASYTYWVRETREDAAPLPVPRKLSADDISKQPQTNTLGSVWNQVPSPSLSPCFLFVLILVRDITWENEDAFDLEFQELLKSLDSLEFSNGKAYIDDVSECSGDVSIRPFNL